jgi:CRP-like cAMP-binding protein
MIRKTTDIAPLDRVGWLAGQPQVMRDWVATVGSWRDYGPGQIVYLADDPADGLYGLAHGALDISSPGAGDEQVSLSRAEPGFWIGDAALLSNTARLVTVTAMTEARLLFVPGPAVLRLLNDQPELWPSFYMLSNINLATALDLLAEALSCPPRVRIARHILRLSHAGDHTVIASQADIARLAGVTRATMQRGMGDLIRKGAIETGYRSIRVRDRDALRLAARASR